MNSVLFLAFTSSAFALGVAPAQIANWAIFGDSYSATIYGHTGVNGGTAWPYYAAGYTTPPVNVYDAALAGATCSNTLTPRFLWPDIVHNELPAYLLAKPLLNWKPEETLFTIWFGGNDLGVFADGSQAKGVSINETTECGIDVLRTLYTHGARNFLFMSVSWCQLVNSF